MKKKTMPTDEIVQTDNCEKEKQCQHMKSNQDAKEPFRYAVSYIDLTIWAVKAYRSNACISMNILMEVFFLKNVGKF